MGEITYKRGTTRARLEADFFDGSITLTVSAPFCTIKHFDTQEDAIAWLHENRFGSYNRFTKSWQLA